MKLIKHCPSLFPFIFLFSCHTKTLQKTGLSYAPFTISDATCYTSTADSAIIFFNLTLNSSYTSTSQNVCEAWGSTNASIGLCSLYGGPVYLSSGKTMTASMNCLADSSLQGDNVTFYVTCTDSQTGLLSTLSATSANCPPVDSLVNPSGDFIAQQAFNWYDPTTLVGINSQRIAQLYTGYRNATFYAILQNGSWVALNDQQCVNLYGFSCTAGSIPIAH